MGCKYKPDCPSATGWCEGPQQHYERCVPFLISAANRYIHESDTQKAETERWKLEAHKQAAETGEMMIAIAERLEAVRTDIAVSEQLLLDEDSELDRVILQWKYRRRRARRNGWNGCYTESTWEQDNLYQSGKQRSWSGLKGWYNGRIQGYRKGHKVQERRH